MSNGLIKRICGENSDGSGKGKPLLFNDGIFAIQDDVDAAVTLALLLPPGQEISRSPCLDCSLIPGSRCLVLLAVAPLTTLGSLVAWPNCSPAPDSLNVHLPTLLLAVTSPGRLSANESWVWSISATSCRRHCMCIHMNMIIPQTYVRTVIPALCLSRALRCRD